VIGAHLARTVRDILGPEVGPAWLERLPATLAACAERWALTLGAAFGEQSINYVVQATRADGTPVVLKVCIPGPEFLTEAEALRFYAGRGAERLLAMDLDERALLLEQLVPGTMLSAIADDEQATHIAADIMHQLWRPAPAQHPFPSFDEWMQHMAERAPRRVEAGSPLAGWIARALTLYAELTVGQSERVVLHGDLHHYNILSAERAPWLAIDPKGVVGHPLAEIGPLLFNRLPPFADLNQVRRVLLRRADQLAEELACDRQALRAWGALRMVLSAWWTVEEHGQVDDEDLVVAAVLAGTSVTP
jgi:streptomycin 6-kinase